MLLVVAGAGLLAFVLASDDEAHALEDCTVPANAPPFEAQVFSPETGDALSEAESYVCHELRYPKEQRGWVLQGVDAFRMHLEGNSSWRVHLRYTHGTYSTSSARYLVLKVDKPDAAPRYGAIDTTTPIALERISLRGRTASIGHHAQDPSGIVVRWQQAGLQFEADLLPAPDGTAVSPRELIAFLSSVD
jgi:hypothetical protein